jgi:hypothetical protein
MFFKKTEILITYQDGQHENCIHISQIVSGVLEPVTTVRVKILKVKMQLVIDVVKQIETDVHLETNKMLIQVIPPDLEGLVDLISTDVLQTLEG